MCAQNAFKKSWKPVILFLVALLTFCLGILAAVFNALASGDQQGNVLAYQMLGGVLGWIAIAAIASTIILGLIQLWVSYICHRQANGAVNDTGFFWRIIAIAIPVIPGYFAVAYCVHYGSVILSSSAGSFPKWILLLFWLP